MLSSSTGASFDANFDKKETKKPFKVLAGFNTDWKFIGCAREPEILDELLKGPSHYITIHGFGGIGKMTLALEAIQNFDSG